MGLKILHSADWHLDSPFAAFPPEEQAWLRGCQRQIPARLAEVCREESCDLVLLSGDLFDGPASADSVALLRQALAECRVPVFISPGNHDFCCPGSPWLEERWPENVKIFTGNMEAVDLTALNCRIYGAGYRSMDCPPLLEDFHAEGEMRWCVGVLHGDPASPGSPCCPVTAAQIRESGLDYLALGHIHRGGAFRAGSTLCAWPGPPMGRGWDETGEKHFLLVNLEETARITRIETGFPRFHKLTAQADGDPLAALEAILPAGETQDYFRVTLTGSGDTDVKALRAALPHLPHLTLIDRTEPPAALWADVGEDTLRGVYFGMLKEAMEKADPEQKKIPELAAKISLQLLEGKEVLLP